MNNYFEQYKFSMKQQWQSMEWHTKICTLFIASVLLLCGLFTGLFIFISSLMITAALYLKSLLSNMGHRAK